MILEKIIFLQYILIWYSTNYFYYIYNKKLLNETNDTSVLIVSSYQLGIGVIFSIFKYIFTNIKKITLNEIKLNNNNIIKLGFYNCSCHIMSIYALSFSSISFIQIIKSFDPIFNIIIGYIFYTQNISIKKFISFIPIMLSAVVSSFDFEYSYGSLLFGFFVLFYSIIKSYETKKILVKINVNDDKDLFSIYFILINFYSYFISFLIGISIYKKIYFDFLFLCISNNNIRNNLLLSSITFYTCNEISTFILIKTSPLFQTALNILKKNIIILGSSIIFNEKISLFKIIGCVLSFFTIFIEK